MTNDVEPDAFLMGLRRDLRERRLTILDAPFLQSVNAGELTRDQIKRWALAYYALTKNGRLTIANFYANSPDEPVLRKELAENVYEEETGRLSGVNKCHMDVFLDFLAAFGVSPDEAAKHPAPGPLREFRPQGSAIAPDEFYEELTVYGLLGEAPNAEFSEVLYSALGSRYSFEEHELTWFDMHARLDKDHGAMLGAYVAQCTARHDGLERIRDKAFTLAPLYQQIWDGFGRWQ